MTGEMQDQRWRLVALCLLFAACGLFLMYRIYQYQVVEYYRFSALASEEHYLKKKIVPKRGDILDRNGHPFAISVMYHSLYADPPSIRDLSTTAGVLSRLTGDPEDEILEKLRSGGGTTVLLKRKLPSDLSTKIADLNMPGVFLQSEPFRDYPEGSVAPQLLGFVGRDFKGLAGLELSLDRDLGGEPGLLLAERDTIGGEIAIGRRELVPPREGTDAILTIDRQIQRMLERELAEAIKEHKASGGMIVVMDPKTGGVLGVASQPNYDLTAEYDPEKLQLYKPTVVTDMYEPGSVMKVITMAAGLNERLVNPNTVFTDKGVAVIDGVAIRNWDYGAHGEETMTEVLVNSCNIGAQHVAALLGAERFYRYVDAFGFGQLTGIELPGESSGHYRTPADRDWTRIDLATNSYGQGIAVTAMQMVRAVGAIANDGVLVKPMIVSAFRQGDSIRQMPPVQVRRVISSQTARELTDMMVSAVEDNPLRLSVLPGYQIAGKTGTAELPTPAGYTSGLTYASQVGFAPAHDPKFVMLIRLDGPEKKYGGQVAAPVFKRVSERLLNHMALPPSETAPTTGASAKAAGQRP
jgi:cell division protein FtsI/penicillin-binding protein 2